MTKQVTIDGFDKLQGVFDDIDRQFRQANYEDTMRGFLPQMRSVHAEHFHTETAPNRTPWRPLAESTVRRKGHRTILVESTRLRRSLTTPSGDQHVEVSSRELVFGTKVPYAAFHQQGTARMPARPPVGMTEQSVDSLAETVANATMEKLK